MNKEFRTIKIEIITNGWLVEIANSIEFFDNEKEVLKRIKDLLITEE